MGGRTSAAEASDHDPFRPLLILSDDRRVTEPMERKQAMNISKKLLVSSLLAAMALAVVSPLSSAYARHGADDPAGHDARDDRGGNSGGHGKDDPAGHR